MNAKQRRMRLPDYLEHMLEAAQLAQNHVGSCDTDPRRISRVRRRQPESHASVAPDDRYAQPRSARLLRRGS
jgi:hypothetical protein